MSDLKKDDSRSVATQIDEEKKKISLNIVTLEEKIKLEEEKIKIEQEKIRVHKQKIEDWEKDIKERKKLIEGKYEDSILLGLISRLELKEEKGQTSLAVYNDQPIQTWTLPEKRHLECTIYDSKLFIACSDPDHSGIQVFNLEGKQLIEESKKFPPMIRAGDIDIDEKGNIYVVDKTKVYIFNKNIELVSSFAPNPASEDNHNHIKVYQDLIYLTLEGQDGSFFVYTKEGKLLKQIGTKGSDENQFTYPRGIDIYQNKIYVIDSSNRGIKIWEIKEDDYKFVNCLNIKADYSIHISEGLIYTTGLSCVYIHTLDGQLLQSISTEVLLPRRFNFPRGLWVEKNLLYVSEYDSNRIQVFRRL